MLLTTRSKPPVEILASYAQLRDKVRATLLEGQKKIEQAKVRTYWQAGKYIKEFILLNKDRADLGDRVIEKLAEDLEVDAANLWRMLQFARAFPVLATWRELTWAHYRILTAVHDEKIRKELAEKAAKNKWGARELQTEANKLKGRLLEHEKDNSGKTPNLLKPKRGKTGIYQVVEVKGTLALDLGFTSYVELSRAGKFKAGDLVKVSGQKIEKAKDAKLSDLFTYEAELDRVIDADTVWLKIWINRPLFLKEKVRLRGIDAREMYTRSGIAAKPYVTMLFRRAKAVRITTTERDEFDRYLCDIFLTMKSGEEIFLNNHLLEKKIARRYDGLSADDWRMG